MAVTSSEADYLCALGSLVFEYNRMEAAFKSLAAELCAPHPASGRALLTATIVTAELGSVGLDQLVRSTAMFLAKNKGRDAIKHAANYVERVREHRNFYVHGITAIIPSGDGAFGYIKSVSAKKSLNQHRLVVRKAELERVAAHCLCARSYIQQILLHLTYEMRQAVHPDGEEAPPLPAMPSLPEKLARPSDDFLEHRQTL